MDAANGNGQQKKLGEFWRGAFIALLATVLTLLANRTITGNEVREAMREERTVVEAKFAIAGREDEQQAQRIHALEENYVRMLTEQTKTNAKLDALLERIAREERGK